MSRILACVGAVPLALMCATAALVGGCGSTGDDLSESSGTSSGAVLTGVGGGTTGPTSTTNTTGAGAGGSGGSAAAPEGPYPFVLAHGFFGFQSFAGLDFATYFYNVKTTLAAEGEIVDTPAVDPFNDSDTRGAELLAAVQLFLAETGAKKVNIIGHSQGGLDARVVANLRPDLVASVVTVATPHYGTPVADLVLQLIANPTEQDIINAIVKLIGVPLYGNQIESSTSIFTSFQQFSQPGIAAFNAAHPNSPGIFYASFAGRSELRGNDSDCQGDPGLPFITPFYSTVDPENVILAPFAPVMNGTSLYLNDGLVRVKDAKWGKWLGCVPGDHLDEIGQIFGEGPGLGNNWKYLDFYSDLIKYMRSLGY